MQIGNRNPFKIKSTRGYNSLIGSARTLILGQPKKECVD